MSSLLSDVKKADSVRERGREEEEGVSTSSSFEKKMIVLMISLNEELVGLPSLRETTIERRRFIAKKFDIRCDAKTKSTKLDHSVTQKQNGDNRVTKKQDDKFRKLHNSSFESSHMSRRTN